MGRKKQFPDTPDKASAKGNALVYRTASYKGVLDDILSFYRSFQETYGNNALFYLTAFLTKDIGKVLEDTHDKWLYSCYKKVQKSAEPALHASVVTAVFVQKFGAGAVSYLPGELSAFDEKYKTNSCALFLALFPTAGYSISPEVEFAIRNKDYSYLLDVIHNSNSTEELFYFISYSRLKDNAVSLSAAALQRLKVVSPEKFYDFCLDYESKFTTLIIDEEAKAIYPEYSSRAVPRPVGVSLTVWNVILDGLRDIYNGVCPPKYNDVFDKKQILFEAQKKADSYRERDKRNKDILSSSVPDLDFQIENLFADKAEGAKVS